MGKRVLETKKSLVSTRRGSTSASMMETPIKERRRVAIAFPEKLHEMLSLVDREGLERIVSWNPNGRSFHVHAKKEFVEKIMPRFFRQSMFASFQRQLNLYGFVQLNHGHERGSYYHELFVRKKPEQCRKIKRARTGCGTGRRASTSSSAPPDEPETEPCRSSNEGTPRESEPKSLAMAQVPAPRIDKPSPALWKEKEPPASPREVTSSLVSISEPLDEKMPDQQLSSSGVCFEAPRSGDEVFFEGFKFRYLEHFEPEPIS